MKLRVLSPREASIFACFADAVVAPGGGLPAVSRSDAVRFFDEYVERAPGLNRVGLRALLLVIEVGPLARGFGRRLRRLERREREEYVRRLQSGPLGQLMYAMRGVAQLAYYGDDVAMARVGYSTGPILERGRELRAREHRW